MRSTRRAPYPTFDGTQNCAGKDVQTFFPPQGPREDAAKRLCTGCPFEVPCLAYALARPTVYGIWGGTTRQDRADIRRHARRTA